MNPRSLRLPVFIGPMSPMRLIRPILLLVALVSTIPLHAQWKTETYALRGGWNAIYLHGDASYATPADLFRNYSTVVEVWRWNPNPDGTEFTSSPSDPSATSNEWTIWNRDNAEEQQLTAMIGQSAYLVKCSGASNITTSVSILQKPQPPAATWLITGANLIGFPAENTTKPIFSSYFSTFSVATTTPSKVYKYIGGDLNSSNPFQISPTSERVDRNLAYWFEATTVGDFTAPVEYELPGTDGLAFGRTGTVITLGVTNRTTSELTLTFSTQNSEPAPTGQPGVTGAVPLTRRTFDSDTNTYTETPITGSFTVSLDPSERLDLEFGVDRAQMTGSSSAVYASLLRVKDSANLSDVFLPVSAQTATPAGLWIGQVNVDSVISTVTGSPGSTTARSFPLRVILHVDANNVARLLSQAFVGTLASGGHPAGVCLKESSLYSEEKANALRVVSSQMPLDLYFAGAVGGSGSIPFAAGSTLTHTINLAYNDITNPFVHQYHPDHDNRDARFQPLIAGVESYNLTRICTFSFTSSPPNGSTVSGWGTTIYGGTYAETISGLNKVPLTVGGTFTLRRISEIATLTF